MLPQVDFLGQQVSRLIAGDNPVNGHTYIPELVSKDEMLGYYTEEHVLRLMDECAELGCNAWLPLANDYMWRILYHYRQTRPGAVQHLIFQSYPLVDFEQNLRMVAPLAPLGFYHRGTDTDGFCEEGRFDVLRDRIQMIKDAGFKAGLGTHVPETILRAEDEDWGCDFYVTCLHNTRRRGEAAPSAFVTGKAKEIRFHREDRPLMLEAIRAVPKPCIAFKVFAGGQIFEGKTPEEKREAARTALLETYAGIKPGDIAAIGCFQRDRDEFREDWELAQSVLQEIG